MKYTLIDIFNPAIIESMESDVVLKWFVLVLSAIMLIYIVVICIMELNERKKKPYVVDESFLKMEENTGINLYSWEGEIVINHRYCTGNFIVEI